MEFLYKLYDMEYFAVGLLIVIAILVFLFLLILFFGKKEEKQRKLEETNKLNLEATTGFKEVEEFKEELKVPEIPQPVLEPTINMEKSALEQETSIPTFENPYINEALKAEQLVEETVPEIPVTTEKNIESPSDNLMYFDLPVFEENKVVDNSFVSDSINDSEKEQDIVQQVDTVLPEIDIDSLFQANLENVESTENIGISAESIVSEKPLEFISPVKEVEIETPKVTAPFSSVYPNNELPKMVEEKNETKVFELPKMADMPKMKEESNVQKVSDFDSLFGDIEPETYNIKK